MAVLLVFDAPNLTSLLVQSSGCKEIKKVKFALQEVSHEIKFLPMVISEYGLNVHHQSFTLYLKAI